MKLLVLNDDRDPFSFILIENVSTLQIPNIKTIHIHVYPTHYRIIPAAFKMSYMSVFCQSSKDFRKSLNNLRFLSLSLDNLRFLGLSLDNLIFLSLSL